MPPIRPSRCLSRSCTLSRTTGFLKNAVMNLPEPSGSSPPEKPPGMNMIWLSLIFSAKAAADSATARADMLRITMISGTAPAFKKARAVSYSQLVPGNTGISTLGFAARIAGLTRFSARYSNAFGVG